jgi:hypothetical protein
LLTKVSGVSPVKTPVVVVLLNTKAGQEGQLAFLTVKMYCTEKGNRRQKSELNRNYKRQAT